MPIGDADRVRGVGQRVLRAFTEPSLFETLDRPSADRTALADRVYARARDELASDPPRFETVWKVALLRIAKSSPG